MEEGFKLPSTLPSWPSGTGFARGTIDLGGLEVCQISTFTRIWASHEGGQRDLGATFYKPAQIPAGFFMLGCYCQPNSKPLFRWVLVGKEGGDVDEDESHDGALRKPVDYTLIWSSESLKNKEDGHGYIWIPTPPEGYAATGYVVTNSPEKPSVDEIRCVRADFSEACERESLVWSIGKKKKKNAFRIYELRPLNRGIQDLGVRVGTFMAQFDGLPLPPLVCLRNKTSNMSCMPNLDQINTIMQTYSPLIYFHPDEKYLPSSVSWYFNSGALLYKQGDLSPAQVHPSGCNLPQERSIGGNYWLDLPVDKEAKSKVKRGELQSSVCYLHIKPALGATFTDVAIWVFYPFNGPSKAKIGHVTIPLGRIGRHVGDWEHMTLRVSNFSGKLWRVYFGQHSSGVWVDASELGFQGRNKFAAYASLNGHALYAKAGLVLQGSSQLGVGIRNDTKRGNLCMDTGRGFQLVSGDYLGSVVEPPWLNYASNWGPKVRYWTAKLLPTQLKLRPSELFGEEGPVGPKWKRSWGGDEV